MHEFEALVILVVTALLLMCGLALWFVEWAAPAMMAHYERLREESAAARRRTETAMALRRAKIENRESKIKNP